MPRSVARAAVAALLAMPLAGRAAPGDPLQAVRRQGAVVVDGRLEEPAWAAAPVFDGFVQRFPDEGAPPGQATRVRVLFDDRTLYLGIECRDPEPEKVQRPLGRRDTAPLGDAVTVLLDSVHDGRTAFLFQVSAAGVLSDGLQSDDDEYTLDWDAVWEGAAGAGPDGWTAELAIPLTALRFRDHGEPVFGLAVKRVVGRSHEEDWSVRIPRNARGQVGRLGVLLGLTGLAPSAALELTPYAAGRLTQAPQFQSDSTRPRPRLLEPTGDLGLDLKTSLGRGLSLQGTVNPDFGQVEADAISQNLSNFEIFFPEKRPFFTQGMDLFRPVAPQGRTSPQQLFYSRRIGLTAPILAAAKISGSVSDGFQIGLVEAFVSGEGAGRDEAHPERRYRFSPARPLWFGPRSALPQQTPAPENLLAAVARWQPDPRVIVGATLTSAILAGPRCSREESLIDDDEVRPKRCDTLAGNAAAVDLGLRTLDGEWFLRGQLTGSQAADGTALRTLPDGTQLRRGDLGLGAHAALGRAGGEPWRFEVHWEYESPRLDLNALGFQRTQNEQVARAVVRYVRPNGAGPFHSWAVAGLAERRTTTDGRGLLRGAQLYLATEFQLRSFDWFGTEAWANAPAWDVREIDQGSVREDQRAAPLADERPGDVGGTVWFASDASRPVATELGFGGGKSLPRGGVGPVANWFSWAKLFLRPHPRLETRLELGASQSGYPARFVTDDGAADPAARTFLLADLASPDLSLTVRQQLVLTPRLTLHAYAQLYTAYGRYSRFRVGRARGGRVHLGDLAPVQEPRSLPWWDNPDYRDGRLEANVVLRWEYRLGSVLYLVYSRSQRELGYPDGSFDPSPAATRRPVELGAGPTTDTFLVKWSYWWSR